MKNKHFVIVLLLWLFAPGAWYLMWKDKTYHSWFAPLLFVNGIVVGFMVITQAFVVIPWISRLYDYYGIHPLPFFSSVMALSIVLFAIIQIIYGYHIRKIAKKHKVVVDHHIRLILLMFTIDVIIGLATGIVRLIPPYTFLPAM